MRSCKGRRFRYGEEEKKESHGKEEKARVEVERLHETLNVYAAFD